MKLISIVSVIITLIMIQVASADEYTYSIGYAPICKHFNNDEDMNEINHGIFISYDKWIAGTFNNSSYIQSWFIGRSYKTDKWGDNLYTRLNMHIGLLYGYGDDIPDVGGWTIGAAPTIEIGYKQFAIETMVNPITDGGVVSFLFKYSW